MKATKTAPKGRNGEVQIPTELSSDFVKGLAQSRELYHKVQALSDTMGGRTTGKCQLTLDEYLKSGVTGINLLPGEYFDAGALQVIFGNGQSLTFVARSRDNYPGLVITPRLYNEEEDLERWQVSTQAGQLDKRARSMVTKHPFLLKCATTYRTLYRRVLKLEKAHAKPDSVRASVRRRNRRSIRLEIRSLNEKLDILDGLFDESHVRDFDVSVAWQVNTRVRVGPKTSVYRS
jgi:hypothetical protein